MKRFLVLIFICNCFSEQCFSQDVFAKIYNPPIPYTGNVEWGNDYLVSPTEPQSSPSGVYRNSNSTIYVCAPDTNIQKGTDISALTSTNNGQSWSILASAVTSNPVRKIKTIRSALDSVYCFFLEGVTIYCWNIENGRVTQVRGVGFRDFDVAASSTGSMYIFIDSLGTNNLIRYGSSDGGVNWGQRGLVSGTAAHPTISFSALGDTLSLNYYGPPREDTATSIIRNVRYRESAPGTMLSVGSFTNLAQSNNSKKQFQSVRYGNNVWFFYTEEIDGNIELRCKISLNAGVNFNDSIVIASVPSLAGRGIVDVIKFNAHYRPEGGGVGILYYTILVPEGISSSALYYSTASLSAPNSFSAPVQINEHDPVNSPGDYSPVLIEYLDAENDAGAVWVGDDGGNNKLYFARLLESSSLSLTINLEACNETDTIDVDLRKAVSPYDLVETQRGLGGQGLLQQFTFYNALSTMNYYLVVRHRNSIATWSKSGGEVFVSGSLNYDFTSAAAQAFGNNMVLVGSDYSFYTGDVQQDGTVDLTDIVAIFNDANAFVSGYVVTDLNCDDIVDLTDLVFAHNNSSMFISVVSP